MIRFCNLDFSDPHLVPGLNLLDVSQGRTPDMIVSNFIHVGELIWKDYWGPRMEDALRMALLTLLAANQKLWAQSERQFTLLDIPELFQEPNFRDRVLTDYVADPEILRWWLKYFDPLYDSLKLDIVNPVMTKIHHLSTHQRIRSIVGQSSSTLDWRALLEKRRILLVNMVRGELKHLLRAGVVARLNPRSPALDTRAVLYPTAEGIRAVRTALPNARGLSFTRLHELWLVPERVYAVRNFLLLLERPYRVRDWDVEVSVHFAWRNQARILKLLLNLIVFTAILTLPSYALLAVGLWSLRRAIPDARPLLEPLEMYLWAIAALVALSLAALLAPLLR